MTETEWDSCTDPQQMIRFIRTTASDRKLRLYVCGSCRSRKDDFIGDNRIAEALNAAERFADATVHKTEYLAICEAIQGFVEELVMEQDFCQAAKVRDYRLALRYENSARSLATRIAESRMACLLVRDIFGPLAFRPVTLDSSWHSAAATKLAEAIYDETAFDRLPILADALEEAGCNNADILNHCRQPGAHVRGCWWSICCWAKSDAAAWRDMVESGPAMEVAR